KDELALRLVGDGGIGLPDLALQQLDVDFDLNSHQVRPPSIAEDGCVVAGPLPHRRCADHLRVRDLLCLAEFTRRQTNRAQPQFAARLCELLVEPFERRAVLAHHALQLTRESQPDCVLGRPDPDLFALLLRRGRDEESDEHTLAILHACREVDQNFAVCHFSSFGRTPVWTGRSWRFCSHAVAATQSPLAAVSAATIVIAAFGEAASAPMPAIRAPRTKPKSRQNR